VLIIFYIANSHYANRTLVKLDKIHDTIAERRVDYTTLKAEYMSASKQSEVARRMQPLGLYESQVPPRKIIIEK